MKRFLTFALLFAVIFTAFGSSFESDISDVTFGIVQPANERNTVAGLSYIFPVASVLVERELYRFRPETKNLVNVNTSVFSGIDGGFAVRLKYPYVVSTTYNIACPETKDNGGATV